MALRHARYKDAVIIYKQLLKIEARNDWKKGLARAYQGRAWELSRKVLYEEALSVLDNALEHDPAIRVLENFVHWSILAGRIEPAIRRFVNLRNHLERDELDRIESKFALALLSINPEVAQLFPEDSKLKQQLPTVQQALSAYCSGDDATLRNLLEQIPFRSPYRDLRTLLSALSASGSQVAEARERLSRISDDSAFKPAAHIVEQAIAESMDLTQLSKFPSPAQDFLAAIHGIDRRASELAEKVSKAPASAKALFNLLINDPASQSSSTIRDLCHHLLVSYPHGIRIYEKKYKALEKFETYRIHALGFERRHDFENATRAWLLAADAVAEQQSLPENNLIRAMFLRRAAKCAQSGEDFKLASTACEHLEESLECDPNDIDTHHQLLKIYKLSQPDRYNACVERAVKQFPEDSEVLLVAAEQAIERSAFKKASNYAKTLLRLDPINQRARTLLIKSHLSHAGKQITQKKFQLAVKEIEAAAGFEMNNRPSGLVPIYRGLLEYAQGHDQRGEMLIELACKTIGNYLCGYFRTAAEILRLKLDSRYRKKYLNLLKNESRNRPSRIIFLALVKELQQLSAEKGVDFSPVTDSVRKYVSAASSLDLSVEEMEMVCETLESLRLYQPLVDFAEVCVKRWPDLPIFEYFFAFGISRGSAENLSAMNMNRLEDAIDSAMEQKNRRVANRMIDFLEGDFGRDCFDDSEVASEFEEFLDQLFDENPELEKIFDSLPGFDDEDAPKTPRKKRKKSSR